MNLATKLSEIKGVGIRTTKILEEANLLTIQDIIDFLPRTYEDFSEVVKISEVRPGKITIRARATNLNVKRIGGRSTITSATLDDGTDKVRAIWFNQPYRATQFGTDEYYFSGQFEFKYGQYQITNPAAEKVKDLPVQTGRVLPVYPTRKGLKPSVTRKILDTLRPLISVLPETLPPEIVQSQKLLPFSVALNNIHFPDSLTDFEQARRRLAFDELFEIVLASKLNKQENEKIKGYPIKFNQEKIRQFVQKLPFALTNAQRKAIWEALQDLEKPMPMSRLLQGDVGAGKTVVSGAVAFQTYLSGFQSALVAPTAILATQHAETIDKLLAPFGVKTALLTSAVKNSARTALLKNLEDGDIDIIVGTHALFEDKVKFHKLGLVVVDEQHRFGVKQRGKLLAKTEDNRMPHLLTMTATPIPRSLQLTLFGDLDISILNELPKSRKPIKTKIWRQSNRDQLYDFIKKELASGRQAYFVVSLIEDDPLSKDQKSAQSLYKNLTAVFKDFRVGLLHGRMPAVTKDQIMQDFKNHKLDILVATTVIEVGVDVPNATAMVIENADRLGLAQLHQLRGRVGRGEHQSYCFIMPTDIEKISRRLKYVEESNDGFYLAEKDLELRGPGEIYGAAQHGELNLRVANLADTQLIKQVVSSTDWFLKNASLVDYPTLRARVAKSQKLTTLN